MLGVGQKLPSFTLKAAVSNAPGQEFTTVSNANCAGKWTVLFFWPKDFTFVCPTEIIEFGTKIAEFQKRGAQLFGASVDSEYVHLAWREHHPGLKTLPFPMLSDLKRELSAALGVLDPVEGVAQRATYIIDPEGTIRFVMVTDLGIGRNVDEIVRVLDALQTGKLCPCNWHPGEKTLD
jgi:peroxiredoxin (alkyl hydroperoxide reductase subunit C)